MTVPNLPQQAHPTAPTLVACLCAAWCRTCDDYRPMFAALQAQHPDCRWVWVDIEDEAELIGELEVETFPTLLIGCGAQLRFIGPVLPQQANAERLLGSILKTASASVIADPAAQALLIRLQSRA
ncbi:thioredoxin family protein [Roseateles sp. GG27B]